jgi:hypothetical protein
MFTQQTLDVPVLLCLIAAKAEPVGPVTAHRWKPEFEAIVMK